MFTSSQILAFSFIPFLWQTVVANTEIVNFHIAEEFALAPEVVQWPTLHRAENEIKLSLLPAALYTPSELVCETSNASSESAESFPSPCKHEQWITLDTSHNDWKNHAKFTLRLSWPASSPADFSIELFDPTTLPVKFSSPTTPRQLGRYQYARIRVVDTGVRTPISDSSVAKPAEVPFIVILEPLHFGVLPATVIPILLFLAPVLSLAAIGVPWIHTSLQTIASEARREIAEIDWGHQKRE